jgi:hypothetical protein
LTVYSSRMGIVPESQVAVQQGVQTRDLMSFLASILVGTTQRNDLRRQTRSDERLLAPEGFYDAVLAYGLPQSITSVYY